NLAVARAEEGVLLSFNTRFELSHTVEEALHKGVPLHFVAEATLYRSRWYWRDQRVTRATRSWRLTYQPLTRSYRVGIGGLSQSFDNLAEAMSVLRASSRWKIAEAAQVEDDSRHYIEFSYRLDTTQLPRPMPIGFGAVIVFAAARLVMRRRKRKFGSRLLLKLAGIFALVGVVPGVLIYTVSYQFVSRSIESWFDVRVEGALDAGLNLGRATLDAMVSDLSAKTRLAAERL